MFVILSNRINLSYLTNESEAALALKKKENKNFIPSLFEALSKEKPSWLDTNISLVRKAVNILTAEDIEKKEVKKILSLDLFSRNKKELNNLFCNAITKGNLPLAQKLLEMGADINGIDNDFRTPPLNLACQNNHFQMVKLLLESGADINNTDARLNTPLHIVSTKEIATLLIEKGANINSKNESGSTPLHEAALNNKIEIVRCLLENNAKVNEVDRDHATPLLLAAKRANEEIIQLLLDHLGNPFIKDESGFNTLHYMLHIKSNDSLYSQAHHEQMPIELNDIWNERSDAINTLLCSAYTNKHKLIVFRVVNEAIKTNQIEKLEELNKLLFLAAAEGDIKLVKLLLDNGVRSNYREKESGYTARTRAIGNGHLDCAELFPKDFYSDQLLERKVVAHYLALKGHSKLEGSTLDLEGSYGPYMHKTIADSLATYSWDENSFLTSDQQKELTTAFIQASEYRSADQILDSVKQEKLIVIPTGWEKHAVDVVFFKGYLAVCNRGDGINKKAETLTVFKIDPNQLTKELVEQLLANHHQPFLKGKTFLYETLPSKLSGIKDKNCLKFSQIGLSLQKVGNCSLASSIAALRFSWAALAAEDEKEISLDKLKKVRLETKKWSKHSKEEKYLHFIKHETRQKETDQNLLSLAAEKMSRILTKKPQKSWIPLWA